jgi:anti-sigma regulatory factor (Ser/Thr protein kinase)
MFTESAAAVDAITREYRLVSEEGSIADARWHVRFALEHRVDAGALADVELVVSELVTNAVRHGPGKLITMRLVTDADGSIAGDVDDRGQGVVAIRQRDLDTEGGMGLPIVEALTSAWGVYPGSSHVWFRFDAAAAA